MGRMGDQVTAALSKSLYGLQSCAMKVDHVSAILSAPLLSVPSAPQVYSSIKTKPTPPHTQTRITLPSQASIQFRDHTTR